ncbi:sensor domain-containing diguanylate cyclase [Saccharospirillum salsuginis]|uniref:PAS domain S-box-containing protein/diguanylate cyclase (GGDEF) domain-containing protein n=1 Tax=Saccharospirillum salsuginis TaxID=418750 RepID=A0A918KAG9_9GAMM|nr:diguanylate cyclase [Saccharospirillum salsuginis]GGX56759.1 hypothetical protein GCM10007392_25270 [Saccharospirillum salsuginis]
MNDISIELTSDQTPRLQELLEVQAKLASSDLGLDDLMQEVVLSVQRLTDAQGAIVELVEGDELVYRAACGNVADAVGTRLKVASSLSGLSVRSASVLRCMDTETDDRVDRTLTRKLNIRSMVVTPLFHGQKVIGVLKVSADEAHWFDDLDTHILQRMGDVIAAALSRRIEADARQQLYEDRALALEALSESEEQLQNIIASIPGVVYQQTIQADSQRRSVYLSPTAARFFGYEEVESLQSWEQTVPPADRELVDRTLKHAVETGLDWQFDHRVRLADNSTRWVRNRAQRARQNGDDVLYTGVLLDITREYKAKEAVEENERRFRALAEGSIQGIVVERIHENYRPLYVNEAAARMFGFDSAGDVMDLPSLAHLMPELTREAGDNQWVQLLHGEVSSVRDTVPVHRKDGGTMWIELLGTMVEWDGEPAFQMTLTDVTERQRMMDELRLMAATDELTGVLNRRQFQLVADQEMRRSKRHPLNLSVLAFDLDRFKAINDTYGHPGGDEVLKAFASLLQQELRDSDVVCRYGGEEFIALLINATAQRALEVAERIRERWASTRVPYNDDAISTTVSIGVTEIQTTDDQISDGIRRADVALYEAKNSGRDRVKLRD